MSTPYEAQDWKNDIDAFKAEYGLRGGSVGTPYEIKPWMNEIDALREEIESGGSSDFSTATVIFSSTGGSRTIKGVFMLTDEDGYTYFETVLVLPRDTPVTRRVPLLKQTLEDIPDYTAGFEIQNLGAEDVVWVEGSIQHEEGSSYFYVSGDGQFNILIP